MKDLKVGIKIAIVCMIVCTLAVVSFTIIIGRNAIIKNEVEVKQIEAQTNQIGKPIEYYQYYNKTK